MPSAYHDSTEIADNEIVPGLRTRRGRFVYNGTPIHIVGSGMEGVRQDIGYDGRDLNAWKSYIDVLAGLQTERVRLRMRFNPWAFCRGGGEYCGSPWVHEGGRYDLLRFDEEFWALVREIAAYADGQGVLLEFVLFDARSFFRGRHAPRWDRHPFNAATGGPIDGSAIPAFYNLAGPSDFALFKRVYSPDWHPHIRLQYFQQRYVHYAIETLNGLQNVCWEVINEIDGSDPIRAGFVDHFVRFLRQHDPLDRLVACSGRHVLRGDAVYFRQVGIDAVHFHTKGGAYDPHYDIVETILELAEYGKPVVNDEADWTPSRAEGKLRTGIVPKEIRWALWHSYLAGGYTTGPRWQTFDRTPVHDWIGVFARVVETLPFTRLRYRVDAITALPRDVHGHGAISDGLAALYLTSDRPVSAGKIRVHLPHGDWSGTAIDPRSGETTGQVAFQSQEVEVETDVPAFEEDLLIVLALKGREP